MAKSAHPCFLVCLSKRSHNEEFRKLSNNYLKGDSILWWRLCRCECGLRQGRHWLKDLKQVHCRVLWVEQGPWSMVSIWEHGSGQSGWKWLACAYPHLNGNIWLSDCRFFHARCCKDQGLIITSNIKHGRFDLFLFFC